MNDKEFLEKHFAVGDKLEAEVEALKEALKNASESEKEAISEKLNKAKEVEKVYLKLAVGYSNTKTRLEMAQASFPWDVEKQTKNLEEKKKALLDFLKNY